MKIQQGKSLKLIIIFALFVRNRCAVPASTGQASYPFKLVAEINLPKISPYNGSDSYKLGKGNQSAVRKLNDGTKVIFHIQISDTSHNVIRTVIPVDGSAPVTEQQACDAVHVRDGEQMIYWPEGNMLILNKWLSQNPVFENYFQFIKLNPDNSATPIVLSTHTAEQTIATPNAERGIVLSSGIGIYRDWDFFGERQLIIYNFNGITDTLISVFNPVSRGRVSPYDYYPNFLAKMYNSDGTDSLKNFVMLAKRKAGANVNQKDLVIMQFNDALDASLQDYTNPSVPFPDHTFTIYTTGQFLNFPQIATSREFPNIILVTTLDEKNTFTAFEYSEPLQTLILKDNSMEFASIFLDAQIAPVVDTSVGASNFFF